MSTTVINNPVSLVRSIDDHGDPYKAIVVWCPGCEYEDEEDRRKVGGLHMLPVSGNKEKRPTWSWNNDLIKVSLQPSIHTKTRRFDEEFICHSYLTDGVWHFLGDCSHTLVNQTRPMLTLPDWVVR